MNDTEEYSCPTYRTCMRKSYIEINVKKQILTMRFYDITNEMSREQKIFELDSRFLGPESVFVAHVPKHKLDTHVPTQRRAGLGRVN